MGSDLCCGHQKEDFQYKNYQSLQTPSKYKAQIKEYLSEERNSNSNQQFNSLTSDDEENEVKQEEEELQPIEIITEGKLNSPTKNELREKIKFIDFFPRKIIGRGAFGKVVLVEKKTTRQLYAMKIISKDQVQKNNQVEYIKSEKMIMQNVNCPFIVQLHYAFQNEKKLFLVMDFLSGGELFFHLRKRHVFPGDVAQFIAAELVLAIEYLHNMGVIYRDLKPENILLDDQGHIKITDFGLSKMGMKDGIDTKSLCGTPEYLAPEIAMGIGHNKTADWYSLGAILYEMLIGQPPFYNQDQDQMLNDRIKKQPQQLVNIYKLPSVTQSILLGLLVNNDKLRLGYNGSQEIKNHVYFQNIKWEQLYNKQIESPLKKMIFQREYLNNFDCQFTNENIKDTPANKIDAENFLDFTYDRGKDLGLQKEDNK